MVFQNSKYDFYSVGGRGEGGNQEKGFGMVTLDRKRCNGSRKKVIGGSRKYCVFGTRVCQYT